MVTEILKYLSVFFFSMIKFVAGPTLGIIAGMTLFETISLTVLGMMTSVFIFSFVGKPLYNQIRKYFPANKKKFNKRNRQFVTIWKRYGLVGIAFFTPLIFTPIGGALLATALGGRQKKMFLYMFLSAVFWSCTLSLIFRQFAYLAEMIL